MASSETIRDAAFVAAMWDIETAEVRQLGVKDRLAALEGFVAAIKTDENRVWALVLCLDLYSVRELEAAGAPDFAVARRKMQLEPTGEQLAAEQAAQERVAVKRAEREERRFRREQEQAAEGRPPTLGEMLARERDESVDAEIAHNSQYFANQVSDLTETEAEDLAGRLEEWWPDRPYPETITRKSENSWSQEGFAAAWMWFGPPLDKDLSPRQWAEIACSGILFHDQTEWLERKATAEGKVELARSCRAQDSRVWHQALQATPGTLPGELVEAVVSNLETANEDMYDLGYIGRRINDAAGVKPLRKLSEVSQQFADALRPLLAADGDEEGQAILVKDLRRRLDAGEQPLDRTLRWLDAIDSEELLEDLFACVSLVYGPGTTETRGSWYPSDVLTPVMAAIRNIGGRKAVEGYDNLLKDPENAFLRGQRDAIAQTMLQADGLEAAEQAARELGLPVFESGG
jgi:hypothetical protein